MYCVYCITRDDGQKYIGKAKNIKNRILAHKKSKRFFDYNIEYEILFFSEDHDLICDAEEFYINYFDSFHNGLNLTKDGSGNNYTNKFTTKGFKFSQKSKNKMKLNHYSKKENYKPSMLGRKHSEETKRKFSKSRKGKVSSKKFDEKTIEEILNLYKSKPFIEIANKKRKNGKYINYDSAFCIIYAEKYNMSIPNMKKIIKGENIVWKNLYEKILDLKY